MGLTSSDLQNYNYFSSLSGNVLEELASKFSTVNFPAGSVITKEGDEGDFFYFVREGRLEILKKGRTGGNVYLYTVKPRSEPSLCMILASRVSVCGSIGYNYLYLIILRRQDMAIEAKIEGKQLIITCDLEEPKPSASGKTLVVASTRGNIKTSCMVNGKHATLG